MVKLDRKKEGALGELGGRKARKQASRSKSGEIEAQFKGEKMYD